MKIKVLELDDQDDQTGRAVSVYGDKTPLIDMGICWDVITLTRKEWERIKVFVDEQLKNYEQ